MFLAAASVLAFLSLAGASPAATESGVQIVYRAYQPSQLTVVAGQTVTWRNSGLGPHTVTSDTGQFDSGALQTGGTFSYTFSAPGTYAYSCTIHPTMHGKVVVLAALPPGFPAGAPLDAVLVHLAKKHTAHGSITLGARAGLLGPVPRCCCSCSRRAARRLPPSCAHSSARAGTRRSASPRACTADCAWSCRAPRAKRR